MEDWTAIATLIVLGVNVVAVLILSANVGTQVFSLFGLRDDLSSLRQEVMGQRRDLGKQMELLEELGAGLEELLDARVGKRPGLKPPLSRDS